MKKHLKWIVPVAVVILLAGAACAYWFGFDAYQKAQWGKAAEAIEAKHPTIDVVTIWPFEGRTWYLILDPVERQVDVVSRSYSPYTLVAVTLAENVPDSVVVDTIGLLQTICEEVKGLVGHNTMIVVAFVSRSTTGYKMNAILEIYTARPPEDAAELQPQFMWGQAFPPEYVLFPGR